MKGRRGGLKYSTVHTHIGMYRCMYRKSGLYTTVCAHIGMYRCLNVLYSACGGLCDQSVEESFVVPALSAAAEVRPKDLQKSVYQCRVMGNRGSGKASGLLKEDGRGSCDIGGRKGEERKLCHEREEGGRKGRVNCVI